LEKAFQLETIKVGKSFDEIILTHLADLKKQIRSTEEEIEILASEVSQKPENYILFTQLFESHFDYKMEKLKSNKHLLLDLLDNILSVCMKKATRDCPFEISAKVFQFCQAYCRDLYGEEGRREFINIFNERIVPRFSKIVLGDEYKLGPIESESELALLMNEFGSTFGKLGARVPSIDEINEAVRMRKRGQKV
jgi:3-phosphoglycerate kinase